MKLINKTKNPLQHSSLDEKAYIKIVTLNPNEVKDIENEIAKKWLAINGIEEYIDPEEAKAKDEAQKAEIAALKKELTKAKATKTTKAKATK